MLILRIGSVGSECELVPEYEMSESDFPGGYVLALECFEDFFRLRGADKLDGDRGFRTVQTNSQHGDSDSPPGDNE